MKTLILTEKEVEQLVSMNEVIEAVESAFKEKALNRVQMPTKGYMFYNKYNGDLRIMPSYLERSELSAVKIVNVHPDNPEKNKLPTVMATIILVDPKNGFQTAIMGGTWITSMRTGAAGAVAVKYLARTNSKTIGIVGSGEQARTQLMGLKEVLGRIDEVKVADKVKASRNRCAEEMIEKLGLNVQAVDSNKEAVEGVDIVVSITPVRAPIIKSKWINPGVHINAIGADAPNKEELEPELLKRAKIVVDDLLQTSFGGEINVPLASGFIKKEDIWGDIGEIVAGLKPGRTSPEEITIFDSTGLAILDAVTAELVYHRALARGIGRYIEIM